MNAYLLALRYTPTILARILDDVPAERYGDRVAEDRFSLIEMVCHLAEFENVVLDRMRAAQKSDGVAVPDWDEGAQAVEKRYAERDLHRELDVFASRRRDTVTFLEELPEHETTRAFTKDGLGRLTIREYLAVVSGHDLVHLEQASWYLKGVHGKG